MHRISCFMPVEPFCRSLGFSSHTATVADSPACHSAPYPGPQEQILNLESRVASIKKERDAARRELTERSTQFAAMEERLKVAVAAVDKASSSSTTTPGSCPDRHTVWTPTPEREKHNPELAAFLKKVAINNEVLVAVSNKNYAWPGGMLEVWMRNVKKAGVKNAMVLALDDETKANVEKFGMQAFRMDIEVRQLRHWSVPGWLRQAMKKHIRVPFLGFIQSAIQACPLLLPQIRLSFLRPLADSRVSEEVWQQPRRVRPQVPHPHQFHQTGVRGAALGRGHRHPAGPFQAPGERQRCGVSERRVGRRHRLWVQ